MSDIIGNNGRPKRNFTIEQFRNDEDEIIQRRWKERIFSSEVVEVDINEIYTELLLEEIDLYYADPIKIGNLEFKASVIIKELLPDALIDTELLQPFDFDFYNVVAYSDYCIFDGQTVVDSVTRICEELEVAYKWVDLAPILREVQIDFLQENKDELLQAHKDELLQEVKEELDGFLKHEDPVEIEIYSRTTSVRRFLNSNGEESFRAVETPEPQVVEANVHKAFTRRGFVVEEIIKGCKTEGCTAEKFVVNSWEHYGEDTFNDLTEGLTKGKHSEGDHTEGICPKCRKPVVYKDYFVVTSDAKALKTPD